MSEYVIDLAAHNASAAMALCSGVHGEIVRCRDCKHFFLNFTRHDPDLPHYCETHGSDWVWPDGFCAWGVRNDA